MSGFEPQLTASWSWDQIAVSEDGRSDGSHSPHSSGILSLYPPEVESVSHPLEPGQAYVTASIRSENAKLLLKVGHKNAKHFACSPGVLLFGHHALRKANQPVERY